ncbi:hypothetical protein VTI74DRAFT_10050 [Chaetomium olivicolor]
MDRDLHLALTRIRIALVQLEACRRLGVVPPFSTSQRRRRHSVTVYRRNGLPVFARQKLLSWSNCRLI